MCVSAAIVGGSLIGGLMQQDAAGKAAGAQRDAVNSANDLQWRMFQQQREDQQPWREAGAQSLRQMMDPSFQKDFTMADFQADPGYAFRMQQGQQALERSAAARGGALGGATLKALARYGQDVGSQEYTNAYNRFNADRDRRFNRLSSLAGIGQTANSQVANAGMNYANNASQNMIGAGNAQAAGIMGGANALAGGIGQGINSWMSYNMMNQMNKQQVPATPGTAMAGQSWKDFGNIG